MARNFDIVHYLKNSGLPRVGVSYEKLAASPEKELPRIFDFLSLEYEESRMIDYSPIRHLVEGNRIRLKHTGLNFKAPSHWEDFFTTFERGFFRTVDLMEAMGRSG